MSKSFSFQRFKDKLFRLTALLSTMLALGVLVVLFVKVFIDGFSGLDWQFLTSLPSRKPEEAGILTALFGTVWVVIVTAIFAIPVGVGAAIYMEEYQPKGRFASLLEMNIANLAAIPSVIYGLLGLGIFSRLLGFGGSILSGGLTLALLILPVIIVSSREALRAVPSTIREASYALGASRWQTVWHQVLPAAIPGVLTGVLLSMSRAVGETAPLILVGALVYVPFLPSSIFDGFTVLPLQIFNWVSRPQPEFISNAATAIIVLLAITMAINLVALLLRYRWEKKIHW